MYKFLKSFLIFQIILVVYHLFLRYFIYEDFEIVKITFSAFLISAILTFLHYFIQNLKGYKLDEKPLLSIDNSFTQKIIDFSKIKGWKLINTNGDSYVFRTKISFYSFGEYITIKKKDGNSDELSSKSSFPLTVFDFGKNLDNIKEISRDLDI